MVATSTASAVAAKRATETLPIVFLTGGDPVELGLIASLNRPGGNATGVSFLVNKLVAKRMELLSELAPGASTLGMLVDPNNPNAEPDTNDAQVAADALGRKLLVVKAAAQSELDAAFATLAQKQVATLFVAANVNFVAWRAQIIALAMRHGIAASYTTREFVMAGGLMSYGPDQAEVFRQIGMYAGRILKGAKPADLPVMQSTKFEFVINLRTAKALGSRNPTSPARARRRGDRMKRREFITLLGGAAAAWPLRAVAQVSTRRPLIAWLSGGERTASWTFVQSFLQGMRDFGYIEGDTFDFVPRFADGYIERLPALAQELVQLHPSVILAPASGPAVAAKRATATIPIVSPALADAVHLGLVASVSRPGGNVTGITPYVEGLPAKQMELAREIVPSAARVGVLANLSDPKAPPQLHELEAAGQQLGVKVTAVDVNVPDDLERAFRTLADQRIEVIVVLQTSMLLSERRKIAALAATTRLPAVYGYREHVDDGGLISYGVDLRACFRRAGYYVHKILNGVAPGELPIEFPTNLELVINLKTAKALGLDVPPTLLARADEVIDDEAARVHHAARRRGGGVAARGAGAATRARAAHRGARRAVRGRFGMGGSHGSLSSGSTGAGMDRGAHHRDRAPRRSGRQRIFAPERAELVALAPDAIVVNGNSPLMPLLQATRQVPVVFVNVSDPVGAGFVASLARPGGNATGFTLFEFGMSGKWLELLKQIAPGLRAACSSHSIGARR